jgi:ABC-type antimicrobial peptide transport system permease subunit
MFLAVRTRLDPAGLAASVRAAVQSVDPSQPFADVSTMQQRLDRSISRARTSLMLAGVLAALALSLGLVGLYGVLSFGVAQRLREFGVRMSLGSTPAEVQRLVLREGMMLTLTGVAAGIGTAAAVAVAIQTMLYGTSAADLRQYALGTAVVVLSSVVAFWIPARRASTTDPLTALRAD